MSECTYDDLFDAAMTDDTPTPGVKPLKFVRACSFCGCYAPPFCTCNAPLVAVTTEMADRKQRNERIDTWPQVHGMRKPPKPGKEKAHRVNGKVVEQTTW